jgi:hypothetical protein
MEVAAQWLDELEDFVFALALVWEPLRRFLLNIGLIAAVSVHVAQAGLAPLLAGTALACVAMWSLGLIGLATAAGRALRGSAAA